MRRLVAGIHADTIEITNAGNRTVYWYIFIEYHQEELSGRGEYRFRTKGSYVDGGKHFRRMDFDRHPIIRYTLEDIRDVALGFFESYNIASDKFLEELAKFRT